MLTPALNPVFPGPAPWYDVTHNAYGADSSGSRDSTAALQAVVNTILATSSLQGELFLPPGTYKISSPILIGPPSAGSTVAINIRGSSHTVINYTGTGAAFLLRGVKSCRISDVYINLGSNTNPGVGGFDILTDATWQSQGAFRFEGCQVVLGNSGQNFGWRARQNGGSGDISDVKWDTCIVTGQSTSNGDIGWQNLTANALPWTFLNCGSSHCWRGISNITPRALLGVDMGVNDVSCTVDNTSGFPSSGTLLVQSEQITYTGKTLTSFTGLGRGANGTTAATHTHGNLVFSYPNTTGANSLYIYGGGNSNNQVDFEFGTGGSYGIIGGRYENGSTFVSCFPYGGNGNPMTVSVSGGLQISGYDSTQNLFYLGGAVQLLATGATIRPASGQWGSTMIQENSSSNFGSIHFSDCEIQATDPCYSFTHPTNGWHVDFDNCAALNSAGNPTAYFARRAPASAVATLTYSASMTPNPNLGRRQKVTVTNGTAMTFNVPQAQIPDTTITLQILNSSGGAMGTVTWGTGYVLTGGAWTSPANGLRRSITFAYDGTSWIEQYRSANDF